MREFLEAAFPTVDLDWHDHVEVSPYLFRPSEAPDIRADPRRAHEVLNWHPSVSFRELVDEMVSSDLDA